MEHGREVVKHTAFMGTMNVAQVNLALNTYQSFKTRALNLIRRSFGVDSDHYQELQRLSDGSSDGPAEFSKFSACLGIVEAAEHDFEAGLLFDMKALVAAEMLGDIIEQADALYAANYYVAAASLAEAVLEDTLRRMFINDGLALPEKSSINSLNAKLAAFAIMEAGTGC